MFPIIFSRPRKPKIVAGIPVVVDWWKAGNIPASNCVCAYRAKGASDLASSYVNLNNPGVMNITVKTDPTFNSGVGWMFSAASSQYVRINYVPPPNTTIAIQFSGHVSGDVFLIGENTAKCMMGINLVSGNNLSYISGFPGTQVSPSMASGNMIMAYGVAGYRNGVVDTLVVGNNGAPQYISVASLYGGGGASDFCTINIQALAIYDIPLNLSQASALSSAMTAL